MSQRDHITNELKELGSSLSTFSVSPVYQVPESYFDGLASEVITRIRALDASTAREELAILSPLLERIGRQNPYGLPAGYFDGREEKLAGTALRATKERTPQEELEDFSPLLHSLKKQIPYSIPAGYFEALHPVAAEQKTVTPAHVIPFTTRKWFRYAAAAVVTGVIVLGAFLFTGKESIDPSDKSYAWVKKNMQQVSTDELGNFIDMAAEKGAVLASNDSKNELKELLKNIPDEEIRDFLDDVELAEPDPDDLILN